MEVYLLNFIIFHYGLCVHGSSFHSGLSRNRSTSSVLVELLMVCDGFNAESIFIIGDMDYSPKKLFLNIGPTSLIIMDDKMQEKTISGDPIVSSVQPSVFIINTKAEEHLNRTVNLLKSSSWWNIRGFYIIFTPFTPRNCDKAFDYLWVMWKMDLINVTFVCHSVDEQMLMFTFNPYTNRAPGSWNILNNPQIKPPWTLFNLLYGKDPSICSQLIYDKTLRLDRYSGIRAAAFESAQMRTLNPDDDQVTTMLFTTLNLTRNYVANPDRGYIDGAGIAYGMIRNLTNHTYDIILNSRYPAYAEGIKMSSVIAQSGLKIVSQPRGYLSIIEKIIKYFPIWFFISILISCAATGLALKYSLSNYSFCRGMSEAIALLFDAASLTVSRSSSPRLFLFVIFFFVLIVQSLFRGRILGFLTLPSPKRNMETFDDLITFENYKIYCDLGMRKFVPEPLQDRCLNVSAPDGMTSLLTNPETCFISDNYIIIRHMNRYRALWLHLPKKHVINEYGIFMMRDNWPLGDRISQGVSRMFESGLSNLVYTRVYGKLMKKIRRVAFLKINKRFKAIQMKDLEFSFKIWTGGIVVCLVVFLMEMRAEIIEWCKSLIK